MEQVYDLKKFVDPVFFKKQNNPKVRVKIIKELETLLFKKTKELNELEKEVDILKILYTQICI